MQSIANLIECDEALLEMLDILEGRKVGRVTTALAALGLGLGLGGGSASKAVNKPHIVKRQRGKAAAKSPRGEAARAALIQDAMSAFQEATRIAQKTTKLRDKAHVQHKKAQDWLKTAEDGFAWLQATILKLEKRTSGVGAFDLNAQRALAKYKKLRPKNNAEVIKVAKTARKAREAYEQAKAQDEAASAAYWKAHDTLKRLGVDLDSASQKALKQLNKARGTRAGGKF